ncbi:serine hydrolase domain-containing protein [Portibacter marinus]|uniref:serine hydrolase domain-containing protein n=1 Tax=Portibacter marinus TaxID=2898660 RepID=UPI001F42435A|nr:serine hydrolase domain-containing protein [Portibacter marinus]
MKKFVYFLFLTLVTLSAVGQGQKHNDVSTVSLPIDTLLKRNNIPAVGIAKINDGKLQQIVVYGHLEQGETAPFNTIFNVASLTKPIVTMLTLQLVESGDWDLDEPLHINWTDPDVLSDINSKKITTRHVLSHQTGFKNWRSENQSGRLEFDFPPGTSFRYSGEGFEYLRRALEARFNTSLESLADSLLFEPLKMEDTHFYWNDSINENRFAKWHDAQGINVYETYKHTTANAADDLLTTIEDYGRFAEFVINGANLSTELFHEMTSRQNGMENAIVMGLGWEILPNLKEDQYALLHTGGDKGVNTLIMLLPRTKEGLVIFTNGDNGKNLFFELIEKNLSLGEHIVGKAE